MIRKVYGRYFLMALTSLPIKTVKTLLINLMILCLFISDALLSIDKGLSFLIKLAALCLLLASFCIHRHNKNMAILLVLFLIYLTISLNLTFSYQAGIEEAFRYIASIPLMYAFFHLKGISKSTFKLIVWIIWTNNIYYIYVLASLKLGLPTLGELRFDHGLLLRSEGWVDNFSLLAFSNMCLAIYYSQFSSLKSKLALVFSLFSISMKLIPTYLVFIFVFFSTRLKVIILFSTLALASYVYASEFFQNVMYLFDSRIEAYLTNVESVRAQSYVVMFKSLVDRPLLGYGVGSFGGPSSVIYNSPIYQLYNFNWGWLEGTITTTDTFYPHLFVELGLVGSVLFFSLFFKTVLKNRNLKVPALIILITFLIDNLLSFSLVSLTYLTIFLVFIRKLSENKASNEI